MKWWWWLWWWWRRGGGGGADRVTTSSTTTYLHLRNLIDKTYKNFYKTFCFKTNTQTHKRFTFSQTTVRRALYRNLQMGVQSSPNPLPSVADEWQHPSKILGPPLDGVFHYICIILIKAQIRVQSANLYIDYDVIYGLCCASTCDVI